MNESPSRYGGIAAVLVLGIGLLLVGKIAAGLGVLLIGLAAFAVMLRPGLVLQSIVVAVITVGLTAAFVISAINAERTGTVTIRGRRSPPETITRAQSPERFRNTVNGSWGAAVVTLFVGTCFFWGARKAERAEYEY